MKPPEFGSDHWLEFSNKFLKSLSDKMVEVESEFGLPADSNQRLECYVVDKVIRESCTYVPDEDSDVWTLMQVGGSGDCEDFALAWHRGLAGKFIEAYIVVGKLSDGRGHAITVAKLDNGDVMSFDVMRPSLEKIDAWPFQPLFALSPEKQWIYGEKR